MCLSQCFLHVCCAQKVLGVIPEAVWFQQVQFPVLLVAIGNARGAEMLIFKLHKHSINNRTSEFKEKYSKSSPANI